MAPKTRAARRTASGALILGLSLALPAAQARLSPPFVPQAPDYRPDGDAAGARQHGRAGLAPHPQRQRER
ncbi:MAG: hypothetical protein AAB576_05910, partial [Elusimicrobiota bacterium]